MTAFWMGSVAQAQHIAPPSCAVQRRRESGSYATVNEVGEPVASGGADMGYIATGSTNAVYDLVMGVP